LEESPDVNDEAYTSAAARTVLEDAASAAKALGQSAPPRWSKIAAGLVVPFDSARGIHPEFAGYKGQLVKQADVTLMQYPWAFPMAAKTARADLDYYVPRSDPGGPSMTDAVEKKRKRKREDRGPGNRPAESKTRRREGKGEKEVEKQRQGGTEQEQVGKG